MGIIKKGLYNILRKVPYVNKLEQRVQYLEQECCFPPGHYYSAIVNPMEYLEQQELVYAYPSYIPPEIKFNEKEQLELLTHFEKYYEELPFQTTPVPGLRYYFNNMFFTYSDAITMYCMVRNFKPKHIIEIGSGFSSALLMDTNDMFFKNKIELTFVDPNPERLISSLKKDEKVNLIKDKIQHVNIEIFDKLKEGDFLLIDTSHVGKSGSDVNYIYFNILPRLAKGVKIHIHDIFFPFEYPVKWIVEERRSWNEIFLLRAFLAYNVSFKIIFFNSFLEERHREVYKRGMDLFLKRNDTVCGGIWLEKIN